MALGQFAIYIDLNYSEYFLGHIYMNLQDSPPSLLPPAGDSETTNKHGPQRNALQQIYIHLSAQKASHLVFLSQKCKTQKVI